jgi:hypothetical protein
MEDWTFILHMSVHDKWDFVWMANTIHDAEWKRYQYKFNHIGWEAYFPTLHNFELEGPKLSYRDLQTIITTILIPQCYVLNCISNSINCGWHGSLSNNFMAISTTSIVWPSMTDPLNELFCAEWTISVGFHYGVLGQVLKI